MNTNKNDQRTGTWNILASLIDEVHREAETAARHKKTELLLAATDWLRRAGEIEAKQKNLVAQAEQLVSERQDQRNTTRELESRIEHADDGQHVVGVADSNRPGGKVRADECRDTYVARERKNGNALDRLRRGYYRTSAGLTAGVTYSGEDKRKTSPWFLNLQGGQFDEAVLLCEVSHEAVQVIHLPKTFFDRYARQMSRDKKGQVKFNVARRSGRFSLQVPNPVGWIDVSNYVERDPLVCPHKVYV